MLDTVEGSDPDRLGMRGLSRANRGRIVLGDVIVEIDGEAVRNEDDLATIIEQRQARRHGAGAHRAGQSHT